MPQAACLITCWELAWQIRQRAHLQRARAYLRDSFTEEGKLPRELLKLHGRCRIQCHSCISSSRHSAEAEDIRRENSLRQRSRACLRDSFSEEGKDDARVAVHEHQRARPYEPGPQLCNGLPRPDGGLCEEVASLHAGRCSPSNVLLHISRMSS